MVENDCIYRDAVLALLKDDREVCADSKAELKYIRADIRAIPAADVRPVVLCRDCVHCRKGKASLECEKHTYAWIKRNRWVNEDDFCSFGVKREES